MAKEMTKEVTTKQSAPPQVSVAQMRDLWDVPTLSQRDVIIPSILVMQPMSPQVTEGKAIFGEFRESLNMDILGKFDEGFEIIPFKLQKIFIEYIDHGTAKDKEYIQQFQITPENEGLPYNDVAVIDGKEVKIQRDRVMKFFVLLVKEIKLGTAIPYVLSFRRTSFQAGQKLATQMFIKNINSNKTPASTIMKITCRKQTHENKTWAVMDVAPVGLAPDAMIGEAYRWVEIVNSGKAKEHAAEAVNTNTGEIKEEIPF